uniref:Uncharacterized protein n=1 Tax=Arion vulgaris TaxID=1028688 RepID=A0A0B6ZVS1_9EUPU
MTKLVVGTLPLQTAHTVQFSFLVLDQRPMVQSVVVLSGSVSYISKQTLSNTISLQSSFED